MAKRILSLIFSVTLLSFVESVSAQTALNGQLWVNLQNSNQQPVYLRYTPEIFKEWTLPVPVKFAVNLSPQVSAVLMDKTWKTSTDWHRYWLRITGEYWESRIGLQKINFGSARLLRTLQWFDAVDLRDPVPFTPGVLSLLLRGYTGGNHNFWGWIILADGKVKGTEIAATPKSKPEFGGRLQFTLPNISLGATCHFRSFEWLGSETQERKAAIDLSADWIVGLSLEAMYRENDQNLLLYPEIQRALTIGADYTFPLGNGLAGLFEQNWQNFSSAGDGVIIPFPFSGFRADDPLSVSALQLSYPVDILNQVSLTGYHLWSTDETVYFLSLQHTRDWFQVQTAMNLYQGKQQNNSPFQAFYSEPAFRLDIIINH